MDHPDADSPPLPIERVSTAGSYQAGCVLACGILLLLLLYVGSFAVLVVAERFGFGVGEWLDPRATEILGYFYLPLILLYVLFFGVG